MKVLVFDGETIKPAVAKKHQKRDKILFDIFHGLKSNGTWEYRLGLDRIISDRYNSNNYIILDRDDYALKSIIVDSKKLRDKKGNKLYQIIESTRGDIRSHNLLFINLPLYDEYTINKTDNVNLVALAQDIVEDKIIDAPVYYFSGRGYISFNFKYKDKQFKLLFINDDEGNLTLKMSEES
jgi:hypothetical protein